MELLYFTAKWCQPCKAVGPQIKELCQKEGVQLKTLDVDGDGGKVAAKYGVRGVPTLLLLDNDGKPVTAITGAKPASEYSKLVKAAKDGK